MGVVSSSVAAQASQQRSSGASFRRGSRSSRMSAAKAEANAAASGTRSDMERLTAKDWKDRGNKLYQAQKYEEAITCYTKAIMKNNMDAAYFTNRALCYLHFKKWDKAEQDCRRALEIDAKNIKANYFLGKVCTHFGLYDEAIKVLSRANDYAMNQKLSYGDDITLMLRQARRERFRQDEDKRMAQEIELQSYLNRLIEQDVDQKVQGLTQQESSSNDEAISEQIESIQNKGCKDKEMLNNLFAQVDMRRQKREIPDYLCGKISFELLRDPVITPSGITYDRCDIKEHLQRVGHFDPITRVPLTVDQLIPNLAMKEVIECFITENEWALDV